MHKTNENKMFHKSKHILKQDNYKKIMLSPSDLM